MLKTKHLRRLISIGILVLIGGCTHLDQYRSNYEPCISDDLERDCRTSAIQRYPAAGSSAPRFLLGIIEFDDKGQLFDRKQMSSVLSSINDETVGVDEDSVTVVFVHGWKHNASGGDGSQSGDDNLRNFRVQLSHLSETERSLSLRQKRPARRIIGVFLAWRGLSITAPVLKELTFWDRKNTAHDVGHGQVTEVLARLDDVRKVRDAAAGGHSRSRLVVVGHSFGGAVVYSAVAQILEAHFVQTVGPAGVSSDIDGLGSLVVLINPAFEAALYSPLSDMANERATYFKSQLPVLAIMTSEQDLATKRAFSIGRWFATRLEKTRKATRMNPISKTSEEIDEKDTHVVAIGHYDPYRTHYLRALPSAAVQPAPPTADESALALKRTGEAWENDSPGSQIEFPGTILERTTNSAARNPYLVIRVQKSLIPDHNDIWDPRIGEFLTQLILISSQSKDPTVRTSERDAL